MLTAWTSHLALASVVLSLCGILLALCGFALRRDPRLDYLAARIALSIGLLLLPMQVVLGPWLARNHPERTDEVRRFVDRSLDSARATGLRTLEKLPTLRTEVANAAMRPQHGPNAETALRDHAEEPPTTTSPAPAIAESTPNHEASTNWRAWFVEHRGVLLNSFAAAHLVGIAVVLGLAIRRMRRTRAFVRRSHQIDPRQLGDAIAEVIVSARVRSLKVVASDEIESPCCTGILAPTIVVPVADIGNSAASTRIALAVRHELVHLERSDPLVVMLQRVLVGIYWFHPVAWWLTRRLDDLREMSCDQSVVERTGLRRSYASALVDYAATHAPQEPAVAPLLHWIRRRSLLRRRIEMLSKQRFPTSRRTRIVVACATSLGVAALAVGHVSVAAALPGFGAEAVSLVAMCPPKETPNAPIVAPNANWPRTTPSPRAGEQPERTDKKRPKQNSKEKSKGKPGKTDLMQSTPSERELRDQRIREFLAGKRDSFVPSQNDLMLVSQDTNEGAVTEIDPEVRAALIQTLLHDGSALTRGTAAAALAPFLGNEEVSNAFMVALRDSRDPQLRVTVLDELLKRETLSEEARDLFVRLFAMDSDEYAKIAFAGALAPYAGEPDARDVLIEAMLEGDNPAMQANAAQALAAQASDSKVRDAMVRVLEDSRNEVARITLIGALAPEVAENANVQEVFVIILTRDDNPVARTDAAEVLAARAQDPKVRRVMLTALEHGVEVNEQRLLVDALAPHAQEQEVKRAFIDLLGSVHNQIVRMRIVQSLAAVANGKAPAPSVPLENQGGMTPSFGDSPLPSDPSVVPANYPRY